MSQTVLASDNILPQMSNTTAHRGEVGLAPTGLSNHESANFDDADIKQSVEHVEDNKEVTAQLQGAVAAEVEIVRNLSEEEFAKEEKKLLRKIDFTLLPTLFVLLVLNYLDRNALASARVQGIEESLGMKGTQFNTAISLLFVGYILGKFKW